MGLGKGTHQQKKKKEEEEIFHIILEGIANKS